MSCYAATASDYTQWCLLTLSNYVMFWHGNNAMLWIINDNIEFNPEMNRLASLSRPDLNIILTTPASRCLRLLLENAPSVVSQQTFFQKVWEEDGMVVSANTLYQNISIIRRGLRTVGENEDTLIITVPRRGFQIEPGVSLMTIRKDFAQTIEKRVRRRRVRQGVGLNIMYLYFDDRDICCRYFAWHYQLANRSR